MKKTIRIVLIALAAVLLLGIAALAVDAATSAGTEDDFNLRVTWIDNHNEYISAQRGTVVAKDIRANELLELLPFL